MKVLHILSGDLWAGAEVMTTHLLNGLKANEYIDVIVILFNNRKSANEIKKLGITTIIYDENKKSFPVLVRDCRNTIKCFKPDIIHSHGYKENFLAYISSLGIKVKLVRTQHGLPEDYANYFSVKYFVRTIFNIYILSRFFNVTVTVSHEIKNQLISKYHCKTDRLHVIHNGINVPVLEKNEPNDIFVIGTCGRLNPVKNFSLFVDIAAKVQQRVPEVKFILAGDGPDKKILQERVEKNGLNENFIFLGQVHDMKQFYSQLKLYLNTSLHEGLPMSVVEAMGHQIPVIAPSVGGLVEIITQDQDGFLVDGRSKFFFIEKCIELYENPDLAARIGRAARKKIKEHFSAQSMTEKYIQLYKLIQLS